jgi:hypothetical protein
MPPTLSMKKPHKQVVSLTEMTQQELAQLQQQQQQQQEEEAAVAAGSSL